MGPERTTPRALQPFVAAALVGLALYFVACWPFARAQLGTVTLPAWAAPLAPWTWLGRWRMFTELRPYHHDIVIDALVDGRPEPVDLAALYPNHWPDGPGYTRDDFYRDPRLVAALDTDLCARVPGPPQSLRWTHLRWPKTLGSRDQPRGGLEREVLWYAACDGTGPVPPNQPGVP